MPEKKTEEARRLLYNVYFVLLDIDKEWKGKAISHLKQKIIDTRNADMFSRIRLHRSRESCFYGAILTNGTSPVYDSLIIPTVAVHIQQGKIGFLYNPYFIAGSRHFIIPSTPKEKCTIVDTPPMGIDKVCAVNKHEIGHLVHQHLQTMQDLSERGILKYQTTAYKLNIIQDMIINGCHSNPLIKNLPSGGCFTDNEDKFSVVEMMDKRIEDLPLYRKEIMKSGNIIDHYFGEQITNIEGDAKSLVKKYKEDNKGDYKERARRDLVYCELDKKEGQEITLFMRKLITLSQINNVMGNPRLKHAYKMIAGEQDKNIDKAHQEYWEEVQAAWQSLNKDIQDLIRTIDVVGVEMKFKPNSEGSKSGESKGGIGKQSGNGKQSGSGKQDQNEESKGSGQDGDQDGNQDEDRKKVETQVPELIPQEGIINSSACSQSRSGDHSSTGKETDSTGDELRQIIKQAVDQASKEAGSIPGELEGAVNELHDPIYDWRSMFRRSIGKCIGGKRWTMSRPNRRRQSFGVKGCTRRAKDQIIVFIDTSGSMSDYQIEQCFTEIESVVRNTEMLYAGFDHQVHTFLKECKPPHKYTRGAWKNINILGRGGTSFENIFNWIKEVWKPKKIPKTILILTDGFAEWGSEHPFPEQCMILCGLVNAQGNFPNTPDWVETINLNIPSKAMY